MKVILLTEVKNKGGEGDVVDVAPGFANNYLLPQGMAVLATKGNLKQLEQLGMDGESLFKSWVNGFAYEIGDVKVDGDTAKATTKITSKQLYVVLTSWGDTFADDAMKQGFSTTDEIYAYAGKTFMAALDAATPVETEVTFTLTKDGKDWKLDMNNTDNQQALADSMFGGGISASEAFGS